MTDNIKAIRDRILLEGTPFEIRSGREYPLRNNAEQSLAVRLTFNDGSRVLVDLEPGHGMNVVAGALPVQMRLRFTH